jgi:hypothetical protein
MKKLFHCLAVVALGFTLTAAPMHSSPQKLGAEFKPSQEIDSLSFSIDPENAKAFSINIENAKAFSFEISEDLSPIFFSINIENAKAFSFATEDRGTNAEDFRSCQTFTLANALYKYRPSKAYLLKSNFSYTNKSPRLLKTTSAFKERLRKRALKNRADFKRTINFSAGGLARLSK